MKNIAVIVAHPDDETLWCGGTILEQKEDRHFILSLCRKYDQDRAPRFYKVLKYLGATGDMGDLDDGPEQKPLKRTTVQNLILDLLPSCRYDMVLTHSPFGEYTRHRRHEEVGKAVIELWYANRINAGKIWFFAYEDGNKAYDPRPQTRANIYKHLSEKVWRKKYEIITKIYGFLPDGFEARVTPRVEAFWEFEDASVALKWLHSGGVGSVQLRDILI